MPERTQPHSHKSLRHPEVIAGWRVAIDPVPPTDFVGPWTFLDILWQIVFSAQEEETCTWEVFEEPTARRFLHLVTCLSDSFWKQQQTPGCSKEAEVQRRFGRLVGGRRIGFGRFGTSRRQCLGFRLQTFSDYVQELVAEDEEVLLLERLEPAIVEAINESIRSRDETHRR